MKKKLLGVLLVLTLLISLFIPSVFAENDDNQEVFPENSEVYTDDDLGAGSDDGFEEFEDSESPLIFGDDEDDLGAGEIVVPDDAESLTNVDEDDLGTGEEVFPEDSSIDVIDDDDLGAGEPEESEEIESEEFIEEVNPDDDDLSASSPGLTLSKSALSVKKGNTTSVTVTLRNVSTKVKVCATSQNSKVCTPSWGSWSGSKIPLKIAAKGQGLTTVTLKLVAASTGKVLATSKITVQVTNSPKITATATSVSVNQGSAKTVYFNYTGATGIKLQYSTTNAKAYTCKWGSKTSKGVPLTIKGNSYGSGVVTVYYKSSVTGETFGSVKVKVNVLSNAKLTLSASNVTVAKGNNSTIKVTASNYSGNIYLSYGTTNQSAYSCKWGSWSGKTVPITITGKAAGSGTVYIYLHDAATKTVLAKTAISVSVYANAKLTVKSNPITVKAGSTATQTVTISGISNCTLTYSISGSQYASCAWGKQSGSGVALTITGKNAGSATVKVTAVKNGVTITSVSFKVNVTAAVSPSIKASVSSVKLKAGNSSAVTLSYYNTSETVYMSYSTTNTSAYSCTWGSWSGNSISLNITGKASGSGTVNVYLYRSSDRTVLAKTAISVAVENSSPLHNLSYNFANFGKNASLSLCQYMFGNTSSAKWVYQAEIGGGGNCFGMSSTSGFFYKSGNGINPSSFNSSKSAVSQLAKSDKDSSLGKTVEEFIMAMQISQVATIFRPYEVSGSSIKNLAQTVSSQTSQGIPVPVYVYGLYNGRQAGHAILAYGIETVNSTTQRLLICDSNHPMTTKYLYLYKNSAGTYTSWTYELFSGTTWGSGKQGSGFGYAYLNDVLQLWKNRGNLRTGSYNLLSVNSDDFQLYDVEGQVVAVVEDGELKTAKNGIEQVRVCSLVENSASDLDCILRLPIRVYTIENEDDDLGMLQASIVNSEYGADVKTTGGLVTLCADDSCHYTSAMISNAKDADYEISLSSSAEGDPETISCSGTTDEETISMSLDDGSYDVCNIDDTGLSIGSDNGHEVSQYNLHVEEAEHGTIKAEKIENISAGSDIKCSIQPDSGYYIFDVKVDGESVGPVDEYVVRDIRSDHTIEAIFKAEDEEVLLGDVNGDGEVNAKDLTALARHLAKIDTITDETLLKNADTNRDSNVSAEDLTQLAKFVAKIISSL